MTVTIRLRNENGKTGPKVWNGSYEQSTGTLTIRFGSEGKKLQTKVFPHSHESDLHERVEAKRRDGYRHVETVTEPDVVDSSLHLKVTDAALIAFLRDEVHNLISRLGHVWSDDKVAIDPNGNGIVWIDPTRLEIKTDTWSDNTAAIAVAVASRHALALTNEAGVATADRDPKALEMNLPSTARDVLHSLGYPITVSTQFQATSAPLPRFPLVF